MFVASTTGFLQERNQGSKSPKHSVIQKQLAPVLFELCFWKPLRMLWPGNLLTFIEGADTTWTNATFCGFFQT